jgi:anti-sigma factor RsiW
MIGDCDAPVRDEALVEYWCGEMPADTSERIEEHLFACAECARRLQRLLSIAGGIAALVHSGRLTGVISRALLKRLQRDGLNVRVYSLAPGETVPCAAFPSDDLLVVALRADLSGVSTVRLSVSQAEQGPVAEITDIPVPLEDHEVLWATPGARVRAMPSTRLHLTLSVAGGDGRVLGEYRLDHSATP